jgi:hypothetical protein
MSNIDYINDREIFMPLWHRARECMERISDTPVSELLHYDSSNLGTQVFHDLVRGIAAFNGNGEFAVVVLNPDPFDYFNVHFGKYPGFIVGTQHTDDDFFEILMRDPGDSPADAIGFYSEQYAVLPMSGEWFLYADRGWNGGTGVLGGPPAVMEFARQRFGFYENSR